MKYINFSQNTHNFIMTTKTIEWLLTENHTKVDYFDENDFNNTGYQRKIIDTHCDKIVKYIIDTYYDKNDFYFPSSIICSCRDEYDDDALLYIVDGQHRIEALKIIKRENGDLYEKIKKIELSVLILLKPKISEEIETFIDINKTSKKVDTSLAIILKNKLNNQKNSSDILISKKQYLSVELAWKLSNDNDSSNNLYFEKILFEGDTKNTPQVITLNSFYNSYKSYLNYLNKYEVVTIDWNDSNELNNILNSLQKIEIELWYNVKKKWEDLFDNNDYRIILGPIGFASIHKILSYFLQNNNKHYKYNIEEYINDISYVINSINVPSFKWKKGNEFSLFTSYSGYSQVAMILIENSLLLKKYK